MQRWAPRARRKGSGAVVRYPSRMALAAVAWFVLVWLFILVAGEWTAPTWVAAGALGLIAASVTIPLAHRGLYKLRFRARWLVELASVPTQIVIDFWIITASLVRSIIARKHSVGCFVARRDVPIGAESALGTTRRAFVTVVATWSPNSYVVDLDPKAKTSLVHDLVAHRASERPA